MTRFSVIQLALALIVVLLLVRAVQGSPPPNNLILSLAREFGQSKSADTLNEGSACYAVRIRLLAFVQCSVLQLYMFSQ